MHHRLLRVAWLIVEKIRVSLKHLAHTCHDAAEEDSKAAAKVEISHMTQDTVEGRQKITEEQLTHEQRQIIRHPNGHHARVLSVAGSGKTSTMAYRIKYLMKECGVSRRKIQVLMFNRDAKIQFKEKLEEVGISREQQPNVDTFHSYAYRVINAAEQVAWFGDHAELAILELRRAISTVAKKQEIDEDDLDLEDANRAISLWKGSLTPPDRAGYSGPKPQAYISIYQDFEQRRLAQNAITFDDFVPRTVTLLERDQRALLDRAGPLRYIIVDEYQDINLGQERLIELLASRGADVMVVGDDDQTIYEWRGARSEYILREFMTTFANKPHCTYHLTRSFRFGYSIAQASYNAIIHNTNRNEKLLLAHDPAEDSQITVVTEPDGNVNRHLTEEILTLVKKENVAPADIRVLGRTYAQLNSLSTEFLLQHIPFKVLGRAPFIQADECQALLNYIRVAASLDEVPNDTISRRFLNIANKPSRFLARRDLSRMLENGRSDRRSLGKLLHETTQDPTHFKNVHQQENLEDLTSVLEEIGRKISTDPEFPAGTLLDCIDQEIGLQTHYKSYYGDGEGSLVHTQNISTFKHYAHETGLNWKAFITHVDNADTTRKRPEHEWIKMTTIHSAKRLEFDYVFIPDCQEGFMPVFAESDDPSYDTKQPKREPKAAEWIENERRLFYVGITRSRKGLYIGAPAIQSTAQERQSSRFIEELELYQTQEIANELIRAARHEEGHQLAHKCRRLAAFHTIVRPVKEHYSRYFTEDVRKELSTVLLSEAERPFRYVQKYDNKSSTEKLQQKDEEMWKWI